MRVSVRAGAVSAFVLWSAPVHAAPDGYDKRGIPFIDPSINPSASGAASTSSPSTISSTPLGDDDDSLSTSVIAWVSILGGLFLLTMAVLWRCMLLRRSQRNPSFRALFLPNGLHIKWLHINIDAPAPSAPSPAFAYADGPLGRPHRPRPRPRGRTSRRAAYGPAIGEGGRRLETGDIDDGASVTDDLPAYAGREGRPPGYARGGEDDGVIGDDATDLGSPHRAAGGEADDDDDDEDVENPAAYEMRTRGATASSGGLSTAVHPPVYPLPTAPAATRPTMAPDTTADTSKELIRPLSFAGSSAETIEEAQKDDEDPLTPGLKSSDDDKHA